MAAPSNAVCISPACMASTPSIRSCSSITSRGSRIKRASSASWISTFWTKAPTSFWSAILAPAKPSCRKSSAGEPVRPIVVLFTTAMDMLNQLTASQVDHSLVRRLKFYTDPALLICDELGYLALDQQTSNLFYQVISSRHGLRRSTIITTNTVFSEWGNILHNTTIATAIADRRVENSEVFLLGGDSLRKGNKGQPA